MVDNARPTSKLPVVAGMSANDRFVVLANTAGLAVGLANTATISAFSLATNVVNFPVTVLSSSPANSVALTITQGSLYTDGSYLYVAISNNDLMRVQLQAF